MGFLAEVAGARLPPYFAMLCTFGGVRGLFLAIFLHAQRLDL